MWEFPHDFIFFALKVTNLENLINEVMRGVIYELLFGSSNCKELK